LYYLQKSMATLEQIGYTLVTGSCILVISFILFGIAVRKQHVFIAPRAEARPPNVIFRYNNNNNTTTTTTKDDDSKTIATKNKKKNKSKGYRTTTTSKYNLLENNAFIESTLGWIPWTLALSYDTMIRGIPGTGTRQDGISGSLLTVNLDGIVLLRFTTMCLRICCLTSILYVFFGIPIYISAQCYSDSDVVSSSKTCDVTSYNLTNYERITIYNVPTIELTNPIRTVVHSHDGILWRLYLIVFCFWIIVYYTCHLLHKEYVEILVMRRVYFFEYDIWESRRAELKQTLLYEEIAQKKRKELILGQQEKEENNGNMEQMPSIREQTPSFTFDETTTTTTKNKSLLNRIRQWKDRIVSRQLSTGTPTHASALSLSLEAEAHLMNREPWIPHPEQRDTVPNIAIYSILVGGLPSLPEQAADSFNSEATIQFSQRESIDWQLSLTTAFFDHCVPNQPGFSSSIAAVTIVPGAMDLSVAWRKWYTAAAKLRRLRFIRKHIQLRKQYDIESQKTSSATMNVPAHNDDVIKYEYGDSVDYGYEESIDVMNYNHNNNINDYDDDVFVPVHANEEEIASYLAHPPPIPGKNWIGREETPRGIYEEHAHNQLYYQQVLGSALGVENDTHIYDSLQFGPEQASVYAREFAQSSAPCCPNGCNEGYIRNAPIDALLEMERVVSVQVHEANLELREARFRALRTDGSNALNIHDQQRGHIPTMNAKVPNSIAGTNNAMSSPHTINIIGSGSSSRNINDMATGTTSAVREPPPTVHEGEEDDDSSNIIDMLPTNITQQPMASRYDRRASANDDTNAAPTKNLRLMPSRLDDFNASGCNLDLEAQLFKKATASGIHRSSSLHHQPSTTIESSGNYQDDQNNGTIQNDASTSIRKRQTPNGDNSSSAQWEQVETLISEARKNEPTTAWQWPDFRWLLHLTKVQSKSIGTWAKKHSKVAVNSLARESSFAVVTFTSRQAAVAARACLADGRAANRWMTFKEIPIPPLADAAPFDFVTFRNCCRPVTLSVNERQKNFRNYISLIFLAFLFVFYTVPLTLASQLIDPDAVSKIFPEVAGAAAQYGVVLSGLVTASIWSTFFALCPVLFRSVANFGSKSTSVASAEFKALQYFWWFMITTAFSGQLLATMGLKAFNEGLSIEGELQSIIRQIAGSIPTTVAVSWLNWIIFRFTITLPLNYLLQVNTFLFHFLGLNCCSRLVRGGGPGGSVPYRIYIDSGVVLMCTLTLAPAAPIVAPAAMTYFLFLQPLLRRNLIFMYRPRFDGGGFRWPFIFDMCISAVYLAILLLTVQMALKQAAGPAAAAAITVIPLHFFQKSTKLRFLRAFEDAGLLQTSLLDGWDTAAEYSMEKREEFRRFLVDAHKAAYVSY
jgi:Calcium-dependent channel, 7TM region, putative phosphate/Late exocytosis, associated with Golgi transport